MQHFNHTLFIIITLLASMLTTASVAAENNEVEITPELRAAFDRYEAHSAFCEGYAMVMTLDGQSGHRKYGFINAQGVEVIPCKYDHAEDFKNGVASVKIDGKKGVINTNGEEVLPCDYEDIKDTKNGCFLLEKRERDSMGMTKSKWGLIDTCGNLLAPCKYDRIDSFYNGVAKMELDGKYGIINSSGREVVPCKYDQIYSISDGFRMVKLNDRFGFINENGEETISCKYNHATVFLNGMAQVETNGKWGIIDHSGREIVPCKYDNIESFKNGSAKVIYKGKCGRVDSKGTFSSTNKVSVGDIDWLLMQWTCNDSEAVEFTKENTMVFYDYDNEAKSSTKNAVVRYDKARDKYTVSSTDKKDPVTFQIDFANKTLIDKYDNVYHKFVPSPCVNQDR